MPWLGLIYFKHEKVLNIALITAKKMEKQK